ncbi:Sensors of blue-light using FAD [Paracoccus isoporae]|uniref:Sensors of blue-light using FAD n=1 Tax=Paracoccus isoporae TaxID=591205 RepID=A0A1G6X781_9RHOB|nr:BLUF domain-containing protein [Paracoccus isoporae]SDD73215.1 Sensors of blue-light using FAD [Paracoccus isoporae]
MALAHLLYRSSGRLDRFGSDCAAILQTARRRNGSLGLTGFLHAEDGIFVQWLEGPEESVEEVSQSILADKRHRDIAVFSRGPIDARQFPDWTMGYSDGDQALLFDFLAERGTNSHDLRGYADCLHQFLLLRAA